MIINCVAKWRKEKDVSKADLARRVGVNRSYITKLEQGKMQPSGEMMFRFAKYLGQPLEEVFQHVQTPDGKDSFLKLSAACQANKNPQSASKVTSRKKAECLL